MRKIPQDKRMLAFLKRSVGQKFIVGLTGLGLCLYVLIHVSGNMLIFAGSDSYNLYAHGLHEFFLIEILEIGLLALFVGHILFALRLAWKNRRARKEQYKQDAAGDKKTPFTHAWLVFQGLALLAFLVWHLLTFKFGPYYETSLHGQTMRDIYRLVVEVFQSPFYVVGYSLALLILSIHLGRGFSASLRSLGLSHPGHLPWVERVGWLFSALVSLGFLSQPLYVYFIL